VGRAIRRRQAGGWIGDEQPGKEHDCGNRKEPKRTAGEVLTNDANGSAGRDANEEQRNAAEEIWGRRYARRSRRWVARRCAVQHERSNVEVSGARGDDRTTGEAIDERLRSTKSPYRGSAALTCYATRRFGEQLARRRLRRRRRPQGQRSDANCAASDSISALLRSARSGSGFAAVPCDRVPLRINCNDQAV
jgi:hypothetical protein